MNYLKNNLLNLNGGIQMKFIKKKTNESISLGEIVNIDNIISDEEILNEYNNYVFSDDDFFCTTN